MADHSNLTDDALLSLLSDLSMDLRWTWNHATDKIWRQLDPELWESTQNPLVVLQTVSKNRIRELLNDPLVRDIIEELAEQKRQHALSPAWFQHRYPDSHLTGVAFFCMEFMLSEALPIYSGGLGNVAGDLLKTASDLGVPVYGIGLLYQQGYSRQVLNADGSQQYLTPFNDPGQLPLTPLRDANGEWLRIEINLPGYPLWLRAWQVQVGRVQLFLLDSNDAANFPPYRSITGELYGGGATIRLLQEIALGIGGWRLLNMLGLHPQAVHLNEGHSAFAVLERAASFMEEQHTGFAEALTITRSGNLFTTHTAVGAGFDLFHPALLKQYLGDYVSERLKISFAEFLSLGRGPLSGDAAPFNTAFLALHGSAYSNGVSRLHGHVSRQLFASLFPRWPLDEVPIGFVTNGVHMPTWDSADADRLWTETCGKDRWQGMTDDLLHNISAATDARLWQFRMAQKQAFVAYVRYRYAQQLATTGRSAASVEAVRQVFDPQVLTIGFARRFVSYKRPNLLLKNPVRLKTILCNSERPVQMVIAGKAHPGDSTGQAMIRQWLQFIHGEGLEHKVVFLSDYDMHLSEHLVQGVDLWINTPKRPWEACGTSGMKVLVNGGINLSVLDGWWDESYHPGLGWALDGTGQNAAVVNTDDAEANELYRLLEDEIVPAYYHRNSEGIAGEWVQKMRASMAELTPQLSSTRALRNYVEQYYLPAAAAFLDRSANGGEKGKALAVRIKSLEEHWPQLSFGAVTVASHEGMHDFSVSVHLGQLTLADVQVELYADGLDGLPAEIHELNFLGFDPNQPEFALFATTVSTARAASDYTARIRPRSQDLRLPMECAAILWQR